MTTRDLNEHVAQFLRLNYVPGHSETPWEQAEQDERDAWLCEAAHIVRMVTDHSQRREGRLNMHRLNCPQHGERLMDLDGPELMCPDCRMVGPDGKPLGWDDGLPTAMGTS